MTDLPEEKKERQDDDEISLIDLFAVLLKRKKMICTVCVIAAVFAVIFAVVSLLLPPEKSYLPNEYTPKSIMLINTNSSSGGGGLSSLIASSGMSGLASLAGISTSGNANGTLAVYLSTSNSFLDEIVARFDLVERYKIKKFEKADSRKALSKQLTASIDDETGILELAFTDIDPVFARDVVNYATGLLERRFKEMGLDQNQLKKENLETSLKNTMDELLSIEQQMQELDVSRAMGTADSISRVTLDYAQLSREMKVQETVYIQLRQEYELLKITMESETPVFQVLEYAEVPDKKSGPGRGMLCIIICFAAFFIAVFAAFLLNAVENIKNDPEAMSKLDFNWKKKK